MNLVEDNLFQSVFSSLPKRVFAAKTKVDLKKTGQRYILREDAISLCERINYGCIMTKVIIIDWDIDITHIDGGVLSLVEDLPVLPNILVISKETNHVQGFYILENKISTRHSSSHYSPKAKRFYNVVKDSITRAAGGDSFHRNCVGYNLFHHDNYETIVLSIKEHSLGYLNDQFYDPEYSKSMSNYFHSGNRTVSHKGTTLASVGNRNNFLFEKCRKICYRLSSIDDERHRMQSIINTCLDMNQKHCDPCLSQKEVEGIARSISNYISMNIKSLRNIDWASQTRGRDKKLHFEHSSTRAKQSIAAIETNRLRRKKTMLKIKSSILRCNDLINLTQKHLSVLTSLSLSTIKRYWVEIHSIIKSVLNKVSSAVISVSRLWGCPIEGTDGLSYGSHIPLIHRAMNIQKVFSGIFQWINNISGRIRINNILSMLSYIISMYKNTFKGLIRDIMKPHMSLT